jgi:hypothetical protein
LFGIAGRADLMVPRMATMAPLQFGQIVWVKVADANGTRKARPAV